MSNGNLELLPVSSSQNQPRQPTHSTSRVITLGPCRIESGNQLADQSDKIARNLPVGMTDSQKLKETCSQKVKETGSHNRLKEKPAWSETGGSFSGGNGQKEYLPSVAPKGEKRRSAKRGRFEDRLERLSQNFDFSPESEPSDLNMSKTKTAVPTFASACANTDRNMTESPQKSFLKNATKFGAKLSSLIERKNSSPWGRGGCDEVSGSDTDMEAENQSHQKKGRQVRANLSLSRKGTPQKNSPLKRPCEIKSEPEDDGYPGRRKNSKLCRY